MLTTCSRFLLLNIILFSFYSCGNGQKEILKNQKVTHLPPNYVPIHESYIFIIPPRNLDTSDWKLIHTVEDFDGNYKIAAGSLLITDLEKEGIKSKDEFNTFVLGEMPNNKKEGDFVINGHKVSTFLGLNEEKSDSFIVVTGWDEVDAFFIIGSTSLEPYFLLETDDTLPVTLREIRASIFTMIHARDISIIHLDWMNYTVSVEETDYLLLEFQKHIITLANPNIFQGDISLGTLSIMDLSNEYLKQESDKVIDGLEKMTKSDKGVKEYVKETYTSGENEVTYYRVKYDNMVVAMASQEQVAIVKNSKYQLLLSVEDMETVTDLNKSEKQFRKIISSIKPN